jgi:hypothetical protein
VQIPEDALVVLIQWSSIFDVFSRWKKDSIPNVNVSSSYLTRLISIACASFQYDSIDQPLDDAESMRLYHSIDDPPLLKFQISNHSTITLSHELVSWIDQGQSQIKLWRN